MIVKIHLEIDKKGNFEEGFEVTLRIEGGGRNPNGCLSPRPGLPELYKNWQESYQMLGTYRMAAGKQISLAELEKQQEKDKKETCGRFAERLEKEVKNWLMSGVEWVRDIQMPIEVAIEVALASGAEVCIFLHTGHDLLKRLPWKEWDLFTKYQENVELVLSPPEYEVTTIRLPTNQGKVRILAILGDSTGIDHKEDRKVLEELRAKCAEPQFLVEPELSEVHNKLDREQWDILFFAGHSDSQTGTGRLFINSREEDGMNCLTIDDLKHKLPAAIHRGLRLAIFNSCDGLGLVDHLISLGIPQVIVMREPVPNRVAIEFLKYFLEKFSNRESLYMAVRQAREHLHGKEWGSRAFPGVDWLPVICQNPAMETMVWRCYDNQKECDKPLEQVGETQPTEKTPNQVTGKEINVHKHKAVYATAAVIMMVVIGFFFLTPWSNFLKPSTTLTPESKGNGLTHVPHKPTPHDPNLSSVGRIVSFSGKPETLILKRQEETLFVPQIDGLLYAGDQIDVTSEQSRIELRLEGEKVVVTKKDSPYTVKSAGIVATVKTWLDKLGEGITSTLSSNK